MNVETLKRFISEEWKAPASRFPLLRIGIVMIIFAPIWPFFGLLQSLPAHEDLVMRNGVINSLESTNSKSGCGTRVRLDTQSGPISFCVQFCRPFPDGLSIKQSIVVWLDPAESEAWQVHQGNRVICSYQNSAYEVTSANRRLPLITAIQAVVGLLFTVIAYFVWWSRGKKWLLA